MESGIGWAQHDSLRRRRERLIAGIYATISDSAAWSTFLRELVDLTRSRSARLLMLNAEADRVISSCKLNIDDNWHRRYVEHYVNACPWRPELRRKKPGRLYSTYLHFSCRQPDFYRTEFFNDWAGPQDIHHGVCGTIYQDTERSVQLLIQRTRDQGYYSEAETEFINGFVPHLRQSLVLASQIAAARVRDEAVARAAGRETLPFLLLNHELRPVYTSPGAEKLWSTWSGLGCVDGRLRLTDAAADDHLQKLLRQSLRAAASRRFNGAGGLVEVPGADGVRMQLLIRPIHPEVSVQGESAAHVAVYFHDPAAGALIDAGRLRRLYELSEAEIRVARAMTVTPEPAAVARHCHISLHTVRSHLKAIFLKTGTSSQAALMKLLLAGPVRRR
ncbi:helix-turn-helix transcriptional regulator [Desulfurivibrio sp. D14AmB]|uniref:helix-turn-helix transcriptional regulator n=1 Tax=Desulfurivibrio sp. D14AmB TaxID=3374370 RepID=UPI00376EF3B2